MPRETYTIGDGALDYIGRCYSNDGVTPIEALDVGGVLQITHEVSIQRQSNIISLPLATAAISHSKPPGALVGQTAVSLLESDIDVPLEGGDDIYVYTTFQTAEGPKVFLMVFDVESAALTSLPVIDILTKTFPVGTLNPTIDFTITNADGSIVESETGVTAEAVAYRINAGPNLGVHSTFLASTYEQGQLENVRGIFTVTVDDDITADDGTQLEALSGDSVFFEIQLGSDASDNTSRRFSIPFEAPIVGAPFVLG